jgi:P4 family phage/plasmid primase-like protien
MTAFEQLLKKYTIKPADKKDISSTNTRIGVKDQISGGNYHIPDADYGAFLKAYYNYVIVGNKHEYLTEKQLTSEGPILVDLDFKFKYDVTTRLITTKNIEDLLCLYFEELKKLYQIDFSTPINAFIFLKDDVNRVEDKQITKDGIHMIIAMKCDHNVQQILRKNVMEKVEEVLRDIPITNTWDDVFDEGISKGTTNFQLYGSRKPAHDVYKLAQCFSVERDPADGEFMYNSVDVKEYENEDNFLKLSVRNKETPFFFTTNDLADQLSKESEVKERKSQSRRPDSPTVITDLDNKYNKMIFEKALEQGLLDVRATNRLDWLTMGWLLKNQFDDMDMWDRFSKRCELSEIKQIQKKYDKKNIIDEWDKMDIDVNGLHFGSFIEWIKKDDKTKSSDIIRDITALKKEDKKQEKANNKSKIVETDSSELGYEDFKRIVSDSNVEFNNLFDSDIKRDKVSFAVYNALRGPGDDTLAKVIALMYGDNFACASITTNYWFSFSDHKWSSCEAGYLLRNIISNEFSSILVSICNCLHDESRIIDSVTEKKRVKKWTEVLLSVVERTAKTSDKNNIMIELKNILFKENFVEKLDINGNLLCCSNGVFDFGLQKFRDGKPEDMCSLSTGIDYLPIDDLNNSPEYSKLLTYLEEVFPFENQRLFMEEHWASSLLGKPNINQSFYNYVGAGCNSKTVITRLIEETLGSYYGTVPASLITQTRKSIGGATPEIAKLRGIRFAVIQEPSRGDTINEGVMKELGDKLAGRELYQGIVTFFPMFVLVVCTNLLFTVKSNDNGTWRRIKVANFVSTFTENPDPTNPLEHKLNRFLDTKELATAFLFHLVQLAIKTKGVVGECEMVTNATSKYRDDQNKPTQFINECLEFGCEFKVSKISLSEKCKQWYETNYKYSVSAKTIFEILDKDYECINGFYYGLKLKEYSGESDTVKTKEIVFLEEFKKQFEVNKNKEHFIRSTRICEWATTKCLKANSSKAINSILLQYFKLDSKNSDHYKKKDNKQISEKSGYYWIGIREKSAEEIREQMSD